MIQILAVALGGALGSLARYGVGKLNPSDYPYHTLFVNITGSFIMGILVGLGAGAIALPEPWRTFIVIGVIGGYTTFSSFSLDTLMLIERGQVATAAGYVFCSVILSLLAIFAGVYAVKAFT